MMKFEHTVTIHAMSYNNQGRSIAYTQKAIEKLFALKIGGYTSTNANGGWFENGILYKDPQKLISFSCGEIDDKVKAVIYQALKIGFEQAEQISVSIEIDGTLFIMDHLSEFNQIWDQNLKRVDSPFYFCLKDEKNIIYEDCRILLKYEFFIIRAA